MYYNMLLPLAQILFTSTQNYTHTCSSPRPSMPSLFSYIPFDQLSSQQNYQMDHNNPQVQENSCPGLLGLPHQTREQFFKQIKCFVVANSQNSPQVAKFARGGYGFILLSPKDDPDSFAALIQQTFNCNYQQFTRQASRYGFTIRAKTRGNRTATLFLNKLKLSDEKILSQDDSEEWSQEDDEFPKDQQLQEVLRRKEEKIKPGFVKPNIIVNKAQSEGNVGFVEPKQEDASIEVKLEQQQNCAPPLKSVFQPQLQPRREQINFEELYPLSVADRVKLEKTNFEKCSRLIDDTIFEVLGAYRGRRIQESQEPLMQKIVQIYDLLSNAIENTASVARVLGARELNPDEKNDQ